MRRLHRAYRGPRPRPRVVLADAELLRTPEGRAAVGLEDDEHFVGLIHLGDPTNEPAPKDRKPTGEYVTFLE